MTADEVTCREYLRKAGDIIDEEQVAAALIYAVISHTPPSFSASTLVSSLRKELPKDFHWTKVISYFDQPDLRINPFQFLELYNALRPLAAFENLDIQLLWRGEWENSETQLSFLGAFLSLTPNLLDARTIPNLETSFDQSDFAGVEDEIANRVAYAISHPLISVTALSAVLHVALYEQAASETTEARRLFQNVIVPNLDLFIVSAFGVPRPWSDITNDTINSLFERFLYKNDPNYNYVLAGLWRRDKLWVASRLAETHARAPMDLDLILTHAIKHGWLDELVPNITGFGLDLAALAHAKGHLNLDNWAALHSARPGELSTSLMTFLTIKSQHESQAQQAQIQDGQRGLLSVMLPVKTISALLHILEDSMPKSPKPELINVQRTCITAYPRLINYGEGYDHIIDQNGAESNALPTEANEKMEEHYKRMYNQDLQPKQVVEALSIYKHSHIPAEQDVFACMIHGLFDEYSLYGTYPLEALATTAVLFGGIIQHKLISDLPLEIGLYMILEAVKEYANDESMFKFGLQALIQLYPRLPEWPGFCRRLLRVGGLQGTEAFIKAEEVVRSEEEAALNGQAPHHQLLNGGGITNGNIDEMLAPEPSAPDFSALHVESSPYPNYEDPPSDVQEKIQFVLNNVTADNLETKFAEFKDVMDDYNQTWFASHLVEQRAKMQPNYHQLYLALVKLFGKKSLWAEVLRETYVSAIRMLNSEATMQSQTERAHLKNIGVWLGSLTLARDKAIKHKNIAFKQLLIEAYDTQRLMVVIPFVCKILAQGKLSTIFKPPNPWVMDIIHLLIELYHNADLKLNLRFEIEVLCTELDLDHRSIEPSTEITNRIPPPEEATEVMAPEILDRFDSMSLNGIGAGVGSGRFSPQEITSSIPDLGPQLTYPPGNDMVNQARLHDILRTAINRAVHEIIAPVVERSVTIAAISTAQMIHKDFATEPDPDRVESAAINMVRKTAGSLALVTSKEPLRASMTNYMRALSADLAQGLPEGTIIMCVNQNLELACNQVEKKAEDRAVPEIKDMIEPELEQRRQHKLANPTEAYIDRDLNRWSWTIPSPYKLQPSIDGLNSNQIAIYDEFARQPAPSLSGTAHVPTSSDATRSMANELLQDQYAVPNLATPAAEPPVMPHIGSQQLAYAQPNANMANGRISAVPMDSRSMMERVQKTLLELQRATAEAPEQHFVDLTKRVHEDSQPVLKAHDELCEFVIKSQHGPNVEPLDLFIVDQICRLLFSGTEDHLLIDTLVSALNNIRRISGRAASHLALFVGEVDNENLFNIPLATALIENNFVQLRRIDSAASKAILEKKEGSLDFLSSLVDVVLLGERPPAMYADFARSLEVAWQWIEEDPSLEAGQQLKQKLEDNDLPRAIGRAIEDYRADEKLSSLQDQLEYVFDEWVRLSQNPNASEKAPQQFILQMYKKQLINERNSMCLFLRICIDASVKSFDQHIQSNSTPDEAYSTVDSLAKLISMLVKGREREIESQGAVQLDKAQYLKFILSLAVLVLNHHHVVRGDLFNQKVFLRLFSTLLCEITGFDNDNGLTEAEQQEVLFVFAEVFLKIRPAYFPGFIFGWLPLIAHRNFMPQILRLPDHAGWSRFADIVENLMFYVGELLKPLHLAPVTKDLYNGVLKFIVILKHDFPDFVAAYHSRFCANIPSNCVQLHNLILDAKPSLFPTAPDPLQPGLKVDRIDEIRESPENVNDVETPLRQSGLFEILEQALQTGPSEDAVAHIAHAVQRRVDRQTGPGFVPINVDLRLLNSLVLYTGMHAISRSQHTQGPVFIQASPDTALLSMLVHELNPEARYYFLNSMVDQLRFPNSETHYFTQALLEIFGTDPNDQEESDIRNQIIRILLERTLGQWPQPWGIVLIIQELVKGEKYMFYDLPIFKTQPDVSLSTILSDG